MIVTLRNLPKHSLNEIYAGKHWTKRKKIKDTYKLIIKSQFKHLFSKLEKYTVVYDFRFKNKPLDVSNTVYMLKLIEDVIFEDDAYKIVTEIKIKSSKHTEDCVIITVNKI